MKNEIGGKKTGNVNEEKSYHNEGIKRYEV